MLASDFLQPGYQTPGLQPSNRFWTDVLAWSLPKLKCWVRRVSGKFQAKVSAVKAAGRQPALKNRAHEYRDKVEDWEVVWRSVCLFTTAEPSAKQVFQVLMCQECKVCQMCLSYSEAVQLFLRGGFDQQFFDKCRAMDPTLEIMQMRYLVDKVHATMADWHPDQLASQMDQAKSAQAEADFKLLEMRLLSEEVTFMEYLRAHTEYSERSQLAITEVREQAARARMSAVTQHLEVHNKMAALPDRNQIPEHIAQCFREFCEAPPAKNADSVLRINMVSLPAMGVQHSMYLDGIVSQAASDLTTHARTSVWIILLPNTPRYGAGSTPGNHQAFYEAVQEAARTVEEKLAAKVCLKYKMVTGLLEPGALRSAHREWRIDFLMVISGDVDENGDFVSVWSKSNCWLRRNLTTGLRVSDRTMYRNWGASVMMAGGKLDWSCEYRQHCSGAEFWDTLLTDLCSNSLASNNLYAHVRDLSLYDPELAKAVLNLRARAGNTPKFSYVGMTHRNFIHTGVGGLIADNAWFSLQSHALAMVESGAFTLPGCTPLVPPGTGVPVVPGVPGVAPALPQTFEVCVPSGKLLQIKQQVHDQWSQSKEHHARFEALTHSHNVVKGFNPGGVPFKLTRAAETSVQDLEQSTVAISIAPAEGLPNSLTKLESAYPGGLQTLALSPSLSLVVASDRSAYIVNSSETEIVVDKNESLLKIKAWASLFCCV